MRAIDADKLKEKIIAFRLKNEGSNVIYNTALGKVIKAIDEQPTIDDWIPVSERLPEKPEPNEEFEGKALELYLVSIKGCKYPVRLFWNGEYFADEWSIIEDVIAWQPLPEPYEEENND